MSRRPALFTQADLSRVFKAAKAAGMAVRVDLAKGIAEVVPYEHLSIPYEKPESKRVLVF